MTAIEAAAQQLKRGGYRVERYDSRGTLSVSAERGYVRETGNLVFHTALIGVLVAVGVGGGYTYTGQGVIIEGGTFVNTLLDYTSFNPGRFVDEGTLEPYSLTLDEFDVTYQPLGSQGSGQAGDFVAHLTTQLAGQEPQEGDVRVNHPLEIAGDRVYLMGNGYAPTITIRNAAGDVVFSESVPFLAQDTNMTSLGVVKVPDGMPEQLGLVGFFYPTQAPLASGAFTSAYPSLTLPVLTLDVYEGDLGIDDGTPRSVYALDTSDMTQLTGRKIDVPSLELEPGDTVDCRTGSARSRSRTSHPGCPGIRRVRQALRLALDPPRRRRELGAAVRLPRRRGPARRAVRPAAPALGQGDRRRAHPAARVRRPRAR